MFTRGSARSRRLPRRRAWSAAAGCWRRGGQAVPPGGRRRRPRRPPRPHPACTAREYAQLPEQCLLRLGQQFVAPGDGVPHGLLPVRQVVRSVDQHRQPAIQPDQQLGRRQQPAAEPRPARWPAGSRPAAGRSRPRPSPWRRPASGRPRRRGPGPGTAAPLAIRPGLRRRRPRAAPAARPGTRGRPGRAAPPGW